MHFQTVMRLAKNAFHLAFWYFIPVHRGLIYLESSFLHLAKSVFGVVKELRYFVTGTRYLFCVTIMCGTRCFTVKALLATSF